MKNPTIETIMNRRSVRKYLDKPIPDAILKQIVKCGIFAPTARNRQSWHFTVITDKKTIDEMNVLTIEGMEKLGIVKEPDYHVFYNAPVVIVMSSELEGYSELNCGCAMENMAIAAKALGIDSCIIGQTRYMFNQANTADINLLLKIPEGYQHDCSICFGYLDGDNPEPKPRKEGVVDYIR